MGFFVRLAGVLVLFFVAAWSIQRYMRPRAADASASDKEEEAEDADATPATGVPGIMGILGGRELVKTVATQTDKSE
jgi:hypothetical protein